MNRKIFTIICSFFIIIVFLNGCIENDVSKTTCASIQGKGNFDTIQEAINAASDGDIINVINGTFYELIEINKSINLIGEGNGRTIIEFNQEVYNWTLEQGIDLVPPVDIIKINASETTISGFKIILNDLTSEFRGISVYSSDNIIENNIFDNIKHGIFLNRESEDNIIKDNIFVNNSNGIYSTYASNNEIFSNNFSNNGDYGLWLLAGSNYNNVFDNTFYSNERGIRVKGVHDNHFYNNIFLENYVMGVYVCCGSRDNYFYNNSFFDNKLHVSDAYSNHWDYNNFGNFWDDYEERYPDALDNDTNGIWDTHYNIQGSTNFDRFPLVEIPL